VSPSQVLDRSAERFTAHAAIRSRLSVSSEQHGDLVLFTLAGQLDMHTVPDFQEGLLPWAPATVQFVIDLSHVGLLDSAGLGALLGLCNRARRGGGALAVIRPSGGPIARLIGCSGLHGAFVFGPTLAAVRRAIAARGPAGVETAPGQTPAVRLRTITIVRPLPRGSGYSLCQATVLARDPSFDRRCTRRALFLVETPAGDTLSTCRQHARARGRPSPGHANEPIRRGRVYG